MLIDTEDAVGLIVLHDGADNDVLHELAYDTCMGDWPVVSRIVLIAFLEYGCNVCVPPVCWNNVDSDDWKIMVRAGASSSESSLDTRGLMPSGLPALYGLRSSISFFTPCSYILISSVAGMPLSAIPVFSSNSSAVYCLPSPKTD